MSIHVGLHSRNVGSATHQITNPFTGKPIVVHGDGAASDSEFARGERVLNTAGASQPDSDGYRRIEFSSGRHTRVAFDRMGAQFEIAEGLTEEVVSLIYQLGIASGMIVISTIDPDVVAILPGQHHVGIEVRWPNAANVDSEHSLKEWIESEIQAGRIAG